MAVTQPAGSTVEYALRDGVAVVELRRPAAGNALDAALRRELLAAVQQIRADGDQVRSVLLAAQGRHFCVGQDLKEHAHALETRPESAFALLREEYNPLVTELRALPQPVVVAVEGACVGAGLGLALCADVRVAARGGGGGGHFPTPLPGPRLAAHSGTHRPLATDVRLSR
ncbi:enoyl-CoA hydratase/isomerase family protein, partial [Streptomyces sp. NPDC057616]|uniref:enoyl-CoA hydratase/isomerase family protein n=1 Tax=Streptomyces sp. NPDC057616 TaxID=3346183 RepID=UPI00369554CB